MESQQPPAEKETQTRWWTIGYRLTSLLVLLTWSFIGFPGDWVATVLESSALSKADLIEAGMEIQDELAENRTSPPTPDIFKTEGWRTLERAVDEHRTHFHEIEAERRWWDRLFNWGMVVAFLGLIIFGKLQDRDEEQQWDVNLPKGRKHLWGEVSRVEALVKNPC